MSVTTSKEFDNLMNPELWEDVMGNMASFVLSRMLTKYVPDDFANPPWGTGISKGYARVKANHGRPPVGDLVLNGDLINAVLSDAPQNIVIDGAGASTIIKSRYAASHQFGDPRRNIEQREFIRFGDHSDDLIEDLAAEFDKIMRGQ